MPPKPPKYVNCQRPRANGPEYYYFRPTRTRLPGPVGSAAFELAYARALADYRSGKPASQAPRARHGGPGSIAAVIDDYRQSTDWTRLAAQSQRAYARQLDWLIATAGHNQIASLTRPRARQLIEERAKNRPGTHNIFLAVLRVVIRHAIELELLTHDPTLKMRRLKMGEHRAWTAEECEAFEAHWPTGSRERLAYMLGRHTGQRLGDVAKMTWGDIGLNGVKVIQEKTGTKLTIPLHRDLKAELALHPRKGVTIVSQSNGARLSKDGMKSFTHRAIREAGLGTECVFHGLRKLAAGSMAEMGCTAIEIASITGHKSLSEVERYTRGASQITLATAAMRKMESR